MSNKEKFAFKLAWINYFYNNAQLDFGEIAMLLNENEYVVQVYYQIGENQLSYKERMN